MFKDLLQNNKQLMTLIAILAIGLGASFVGIHFVIEKTSERVIQKLKKDYSPSPYGPGLDPDKLDPSIKKMSPLKTSWDNDWEKDRR